jgi:hypothetical protein
MRERVINFVDGQENGRDTTFYETGCMKVIREHNNGKEAGVWTYYYDSTAQVAWRMGFLNGEKHGEHIYFSKKGDTLSQEFFKNGLLHGPRKKLPIIKMACSMEVVFHIFKTGKFLNICVTRLVLNKVSRSIFTPVVR